MMSENGGSAKASPVRKYNFPFMRFTEIDGGSVFLNPAHIVVVKAAASNPHGQTSIRLRDGEYMKVHGSFRQIMNQLSSDFPDLLLDTPECNKQKAEEVPDFENFLSPQSGEIAFGGMPGKKEPSFKPGDVVCLRSGGVNMTVCSDRIFRHEESIRSTVNSNVNGDHYECSFFDGSGEFCTANFHVNSLDMVSPA